MKTLQINEKNARELYKTASPEFKQTLIDTFGADYFSENPIETIKTFEDACETCGVLDTLIVSVTDTKDEGAYKKLKIIARALNQDWKANFNDGSQQKWYPWFVFNGSGFGFSGTDYAYSLTYAGVGSRLCFKSKELAEYAGKQFLSIYNDYLL